MIGPGRINNDDEKAAGTTQQILARRKQKADRKPIGLSQMSGEPD